MNNKEYFLQPVAGDTQILTDKGYFDIKSLSYNASFKVWNGYGWKKVNALKISNKTKLFRVKMSNGTELSCTSKHKWYIGEFYKYTEDLTKDDIIIDSPFPVLEPETDPEFPEDNYYVPINHSIKTKIHWLNNIFKKYKTLSGLMYKVEDVQLLLSTVNIKSRISSYHNYESQILMEEGAILKLKELGLYLNDYNLCSYRKPWNNIPYIVEYYTSNKILMVISEGKIDETYCLYYI